MKASKVTNELRDKKPSYARVFRRRPFFLLWLSQFVSRSGDYVLDIAVIWFVLTTTESVLAVGFVAAATVVPRILVGPFTGVYVDRHNRLRLYRIANLVEGLTVATLSVLFSLGRLDFVVLLVLILSLNAVAQLTGVATSSMIPQLVDLSDLAPANSLFSLSNSINQLTSLSIGGVVVALVGVIVPIQYDSLTFFVAFVVSFFIRLPTRGKINFGEGGRKGYSRFFDELKEGLLYVRNNNLVVELIAIAIVWNFFGSAALTLLAPYAKFVLYANASVYGFLEASLAVGVMGGALLLGKFQIRHKIGALIFGGALASGFSVTLLGITTSLPIALILIAGFGAMNALTNVPLEGLLQARIPTQIFGRVASIFVAAASAAQPLGAIVGGGLGSIFSVSQVYVVSGLGIVITSSFGYFVLRDLRRATY